MKDWDRKHSEEFARRLSLGQPAYIPVTPDVPEQERETAEKIKMPVILTPDPPPEPAVPLAPDIASALLLHPANCPSVRAATADWRMLMQTSYTRACLTLARFVWMQACAPSQG